MAAEMNEAAAPIEREFSTLSDKDFKRALTDVAPHLRAFAFRTGAKRGDKCGHGDALLRLGQFLDVLKKFFHQK